MHVELQQKVFENVMFVDFGDWSDLRKVGLLLNSGEDDKSRNNVAFCAWLRLFTIFQRSTYSLPIY